MAIIKKAGVPIGGGREPDALTGWRRFTRFRPGERHAAKNSYNRRVRRRPIKVDDHDED